MDRDALAAAVAQRYWHHTIDLGQGVVTPGGSTSVLRGRELPDFAGRSVLDIGAWDGYYSFLAESQGAARVVALDHYVWGVDLQARNEYWAECTRAGTLPDQARDLTDFWRPDLPGKRGFDLAAEALDSRVEAVVGDVATIDLEPLGTFDVVLFLGVLYHLPEPFSALQRVRSLTSGVAVIETEALVVPGHPSAALVEFTAGTLSGHDYGNWFTPTVPALRAMCIAAGFTRVDVISEPSAPAPAAPPAAPGSRLRQWRRRQHWRDTMTPAPPQPPSPPPPPQHGRAVVHAYP
ncbi:MAG TPA: DUF1698 domain-containing protein [Acidimicrobiales bacterium]|nr:DUF1698 domain-containing protein [Acidimicrobiales bacterium]